MPVGRASALTDIHEGNIDPEENLLPVQIQQSALAVDLEAELAQEILSYQTGDRGVRKDVVNRDRNVFKLKPADIHRA